jgi:hypothetical protein
LALTVLTHHHFFFFEEALKLYSHTTQPTYSTLSQTEFDLGTSFKKDHVTTNCTRQR